jgi:hypothetical protein
MEGIAITIHSYNLAFDLLQRSTKAVEGPRSNRGTPTDGESKSTVHPILVVAHDVGIRDDLHGTLHQPTVQT